MIAQALVMVVKIACCGHKRGGGRDTVDTAWEERRFEAWNREIGRDPLPSISEWIPSSTKIGIQQAGQTGSLTFRIIYREGEWRGRCNPVEYRLMWQQKSWRMTELKYWNGTPGTHNHQFPPFLLYQSTYSTSRPLSNETLSEPESPSALETLASKLTVSTVPQFVVCLPLSGFQSRHNLQTPFPGWT